MFGINTEILVRWLRAHLKVWVTEQDLNWVSTNPYDWRRNSQPLKLNLFSLCKLYHRKENAFNPRKLGFYSTQMFYICHVKEKKYLRFCIKGFFKS